MGRVLSEKQYTILARLEDLSWKRSRTWSETIPQTGAGRDPGAVSDLPREDPMSHVHLICPHTLGLLFTVVVLLMAGFWEKK